MEEKTVEKMCGAKTRAGTSCRRRPTYQGRWYKPENSRCHLHGGKSLKGFAHPNFKHGKYSKYLQSLGDEHKEEVMRRKRKRAINKAVREFIKTKGRAPNYEESARILKNLKY